MAVDRRAAGLHEEDVGAADRLPVAAVRLPVREGLVTRRRGLYLLTVRGRRELELQRTLRRTVVRALGI